MHHISYQLTPSKQPNRGGRIGSSKLRTSQERSRDFTGLEGDVNRYDLLLLVKRIGKRCGFTPRMIALLDYYMAFSKDIDWEEGSSPIVYQSLSKTALDIGVTERQIQKLEKALFEAGAITWHDSGNHRRFGKRCNETGRILYAYGVDLTPLAYLKPKLEEQLHEKKLYDEAWMETKRQISYYRSQLRNLMGEMERLQEEEGADYSSALHDLQEQYDPISVQIRTSLSLEKLRELLGKHKTLYETMRFRVDPNPLKQSQKTQECSPTSEQKFTVKKTTIKQQSDKSDTGKNEFLNLQGKGSGSVRAPSAPPQKLERPVKRQEHFDDDEEAIILSTGLQHITLKQAINASSDRLQTYLPAYGRPVSWNDFVEAAYKLKGELSISQSSWSRACSVLGRTGAAICLVITDQAAQRDYKPVHKTGGYFNAMINRALEGKLHLNKSIFAILKKEPIDLT